jgi:hypothetical protein
MPISFACKCGRKLETKDDQAGKRVQCPACGRALTVPPPPKEQSVESDWQIDPSERAAEKAESAGVARQGRANVVRVHATETLRSDLVVQGVFTCWHCRTDIPFSAQVFGRVGLGGAVVTLGCPKCNARIWLGFSTHLTAEGTDVYLYAPSHTRGYTRSEDDTLPAPTFRVDRVGEVPARSANPLDKGWVNTLLSGLAQAVGRRDPYQEVSQRASQLVGQAMSPRQLEAVCRSVQGLLAKESTTYLRAILAEALAGLRDEGAAQVVQAALRQALEDDDPGDPANLPLHDLCVVGLLFGDGNSFLEALSRGLDKLEVPTRACRFGQRLKPREVAEMIHAGSHIDSYASTLGGSNWQHVHPLLPLWVDEDEDKKAGTRKGWLNRLFRR